ncbi:tannase/feruloyl esterase family alpha/beta hydrolase [Actinoplanes sp. ATCC 53533]|uniref:tannase/feruloyl esterase family alpha/beta hydrolase n=1 Tax=Actinoplanes sp. ATCC 53533 TaxID=1288362 RepID=UPI000F76EE27|nr:tannase/feruloyl esterase family alpha/beta hydrolase [Actinoplanes sp. ATCC 53533]RSM72274.1 tannase/feruloyl esterase family alpha/beta hydrolase [Actinoplanes sp. ATCC 53533]
MTLRSVVAAPLLLAVLLPVPAAARQADCPGVRVPGAEHSITACLADLTTTGTVPSGHTDPADWAGLEAPGTVTPSGVPGVQVDGYFPDTSTTNTNHGWQHDSQFVLRLPTRWNGGLVVAGPPATREQFANDRIISDQVLAKGYAYAATDKGNTGAQIYRDGHRPGDAIMEWHQRVTQLTVAAGKAAARHYGQAPRATYAAGLSAGGYLVRWQLENRPDLYTGGLDWNALIFTRSTSMLTTLPPALRAYPRYAAGDPEAHAELIAAGYPKGSEALWGYHHKNQWDFLQRITREELDPRYDGTAEAGTPFCAEGTGAGCDTDYNLSVRPRSVHQAIARVALTGRIKRPLVSIQGTLDALTPPATYGDIYHRMVTNAGRGGLHRYSHIAGGTHTDGLVPIAPAVLRPMLPSFTRGFAELETWTGRG